MICYIIHQMWTSTVSAGSCAFSDKREKLLTRGFEEAFHLSKKDLEFSYGIHGKPLVKAPSGVYFNLTHTHQHRKSTGLSYIAGGFSNCELGIDCEFPRPVSQALFHRVLSPEEKILVQSSKDPEILFLRLWTLKESYLKYTGDGLSQDLSSLNFFPLNEGGFSLTDHPEVQFMQFDLQNDLILSLCTEKKCQVKFLPLH